MMFGFVAVCKICASVWLHKMQAKIYIEYMFRIKTEWLSATLDNSDRQAGTEKNRYLCFILIQFLCLGNLN